MQKHIFNVASSIGRQYDRLSPVSWYGLQLETLNTKSIFPGNCLEILEHTKMQNKHLLKHPFERKVSGIIWDRR